MTAPASPPTSTALATAAPAAETVRVPVSITDPYADERTETHPVKLRLTRGDGSVRRVGGDRRVLERPNQKRPLRQLLQHDGVLYEPRGVDGAEHLFGEVAVLRLDATMTAEEKAIFERGRHAGIAPAEEDAIFERGRKAGIEQAAAIVDTKRTAFESATYPLEQTAIAIRKFGAGQ
jgi:hypothetical protein